MGEEPERLRAQVEGEVPSAWYLDMKRERDALLAEVERIGQTLTEARQDYHASLAASFRKRDELRGEVERLAGELDGPSGLREQLVAARNGEKIEFRLRKKAEAERERLTGRVEVAEKNADISAADAERWEAKALRLAGRVAELEANQRTGRILHGDANPEAWPGAGADENDYSPETP